MQGVLENRLINLLHEFDVGLTLSYLEKIKKLKDKAENEDLLDLFTAITDPTLADPIAFRIEFSEPILVMLSHPLCRMHARVHYPIEFEWERFYRTQLGMLPVYLVDLNVITLIKFWAEAAEQVSPQALRGILTSEALCMKLAPAIRNISYSTMNFVIAFGANLWKFPETVQKIMEAYLKYSFWSSPKPGYSFSTHFLHSRASIKYVLKVAKTLCLIDEIGASTNLEILNRTIKVHKVSIRMVAEKNGAFFFMRRRAYLPHDVLNELLSAQSQDQISLSESFLNAIVLEVREKTNSFELLSVVSDIGASYFELAQTVIAYVLMKIFNSNNKTVYICNVDELKVAFTDMLKQIGRHVKLPSTLSESAAGAFDIALESHYPVFIVEKGNIYFLHPMVFSYLCSKDRSYIFQKERKGELIKLLNFFEKANGEVPYIDLYLDETLDMFRGESKRELLAGIFRLIKRIKTLKLLQSCF